MEKERTERNDRRNRKSRKKVCAFCMDKIENIDYKDVPRLKLSLIHISALPSASETSIGMVTLVAVSLTC